MNTHSQPLQPRLPRVTVFDLTQAQLDELKSIDNALASAKWDARQALTDLPQGQLRQSLQRGDAYKKMMALFDGEGRGANMPGTQGTAWGLINAVTEYVDHQPKGTRQSAADRYFSAWLGRGQALKQEALVMARLL